MKNVSKRIQLLDTHTHTHPNKRYYFPHTTFFLSLSLSFFLSWTQTDNLQQASREQESALSWLRKPCSFCKSRPFGLTSTLA